MSSRLDSAPDDLVVTEAKRLQRDLDEIRARQPIQRALISYSYETVTSYLWDAVITGLNGNIRLNVDFLGDGTQSKPYGVDLSSLYCGGTSPANLMKADLIFRDNGAYASYLHPLFGIPNSVRWQLDIRSLAPVDIYVKMKVACSCPGQLFISVV